MKEFIDEIVEFDINSLKCPCHIANNKKHEKSLCGIPGIEIIWHGSFVTFPIPEKCICGNERCKRCIQIANSKRGG